MEQSEEEYEELAKAKDDCWKPHNECWCVEHPEHPKCKEYTAPINEGILLLLLVGAILGLIKLIKYEKNSN